jgi:dolichyl-phosphate beta-glucosyltransferase
MPCPDDFQQLLILAELFEGPAEKTGRPIGKLQIRTGSGSEHNSGRSESVPSSGPDLSIIIPAFNERATITGTLSEVRGYLDARAKTYEVIVCADGNDGTRELTAEFIGDDSRFSVLGSAQRGGKGRGVRAGIKAARGQIVGFVDADYKTPIQEIEKILPFFSEGYDVVIGSRGMSDSQIERQQKMYRRIGSRVFAFGMRTVTGLRDVIDTQCGFKFFTRRAARDIFSRQKIDGYMFDVEILRLAQMLNYKIKEVGIRWHDDGDSRLELVAGNWRNAKDIFRIGLSRFKPPIAREFDNTPAQEHPAPKSTAA